MALDAQVIVSIVRWTVPAGVLDVGRTDRGGRERVGYYGAKQLLAESCRCAMAGAQIAARPDRQERRSRPSTTPFVCGGRTEAGPSSRKQCRPHNCYPSRLTAALVTAMQPHKQHNKQQLREQSLGRHCSHFSSLICE
uniref:Uncharacterized protein n=1 Tax=Plectus sambesii TaxID=2011161 RepID=A0A914WHE0_9BILA